MRNIFQLAIAQATTAQFIIISLLNLINAIVTSAHVCTTKPNCATNLVLPIVYFIGATIWFGFIWVLSFAVQDRRSKRLTQLLLAVEALVALVALFDFSHNHSGFLGKLISFCDALLAIWVALLAIRLLRAKGGRVRKRVRRPITNS